MEKTVVVVVGKTVVTLVDWTVAWARISLEEFLVKEQGTQLPRQMVQYRLH